MFNHSITVHNANAKPNASRPLLGMMLENCHDDDGMHLGPSGTGGNTPYYDTNGELWCPFHTYRTSGDARPTFGSLMNNLNSTRAIAARNLSVPGCWGYVNVIFLLLNHEHGYCHRRVYCLLPVLPCAAISLHHLVAASL